MFNLIHMNTEKRSPADFEDETWVFVNGRMDKENVVYTYNGILFSFKKMGYLPYATPWIKLENTMLKGKSQSYKDRISIIPFTWGIWNSQTHRSRGLIIARGGERGKQGAALQQV